MDIDDLLVRHLDEVRAYVRLHLGGALRARESRCDVVQSVCREILLHRDRFQHGGDDEFRRWLHVTVLRKVRNKLKHHQAQRRDVRREVEAPPMSDDGLAALYRTFSTPSRALVAHELVARFEQAFDELPEDHREVILQCRVLGLPHREVAARLGRSEAATRQLLHRALATLAASLDTES